MPQDKASRVPGLEAAMSAAIRGAAAPMAPFTLMPSAASTSSGGDVTVHAPINVTVNGWTEADVIPALQREMKRQISDFHGRALALVRAKG